ncbi:MAG TPA: hypothetical protein DGT23_32395 [Micromonosporaceae bacterium]|nr:hypothetical protein [Micromonosporaceae bacterium]
MPRVKIDTPGVTIELDAGEVSVAELGKQAMELYREANEVDSKLASGPAYGLAQERRGENLLGFGTRWSQPRPTQHTTDTSPIEAW